MDLRFTPEELAFRDEVRAFFRANLPESIRTKLVEGKISPRTTSSPGSASSTRRAGRWPTGRSNGAAPVDAGAAVHFPGRAAADPGAAAARLWRHDGRAGDDRLRLGRAEEALICRASPISTFGGARDFPSPVRARTSPRCAPRPSATAITTSSTARRPGRPWRSTPTGSSAWCAPIRRRRSRKGFPSC